jgi:hypothetical protein
LAFLNTFTGSIKIPPTALSPPHGGGGGVLFAENSVYPLQGLGEALLGEDEVSQVPLYIPGIQEVCLW